MPQGQSRVLQGLGGGQVKDEQSVDAQIAARSTVASADARVVIDFRAGPDGVGPVMGFDSGDFFPSAPATDLEPTESPDTLETALVR